MQAGDDNAADAAIVNVVGVGECAAAINGDAVAVVGQTRGNLLGEAFEAAVAIGDAASSDDGDVHGSRCSLFVIGRQLSAISFQLNLTNPLSS